MKKTVSSLIFYNKQLLLLHRDNIPTILDPNMWQSIGGHVDEGETIDDAVKREIKEETNLSPSNISYFGKLVVNEEKISAIYLIYLDEDEVKYLKLGNEGQNLRFFDIDEVDKLDLAPAVRSFYNKYKNELEELSEGKVFSPKDFGLEG